MDTERSRTRTCGAAGGSSPPAAAGRSHRERPRLALPSRWKPLLRAGAPGEQGLWECRPRQVTPCPAGAAGPSPGAGQSSPQGSVSPQQRGRRGSQGQKLRPARPRLPSRGPGKPSWALAALGEEPMRTEHPLGRQAAGALPDAARNPRRRRKTQNPTPLSPRAHVPPTPPTRGTAQGTAWGGGLALPWKTG